MKRPVVGSYPWHESWSRPDRPLAVSQLPDPRSRLRCSSGYTLVEILVATVLSLILLGAVVRMFGDVGESITDSRSMLESADRLRVAEARLQLDLAGVTATLNPPRKPENNEGYFEYIEGPIGVPPPGITSSMTLPSAVAVNSDATTADTTAGDFDDILMFTTRSSSRPFIGKYNGGTIQSDVAEVAWFVRGTTLHRRVLLVAPGTGPWPIASATGFYAANDISASIQNRTGTPQLTANTLGDLTRRECRFAHGSATFPYDVRNWAWTYSSLSFPTLPTLCECSLSTWAVNANPTPSPAPATALDFWTNASGYRQTDYAMTGSVGSRIADDVILTNVIGFDVKGWDPTVGAYVDLGYNGVTYAFVAGTTAALGLGHLGNTSCGWSATASTPRVYDTYSTSYYPDAASNGLDDNNTGIVDADVEKQYFPPYPIPLRGIQVKIRTFEPDSKQVREVTVVQDFLPQ